ncbi:MAG TPA: phosphatase PAP2 family protein [Anaerolineales bacterium]|nr:phosphatase PAP2 family protein [Anaerolineales bacterium]
MEFLLQTGVDWVVAVQSLGGWLEAPMEFFTFLGLENFYLLVLPLLYWSVDAGLGLRVGVVLITSNALLFIFKLIFAAPRPYWVSAQVKALAAESTFGIPSGHAQNAVALWGIMASGSRRRWAWIAAFTLAFLIGFSRIYLGVHFVHDVIAGWLIGGLLLWAIIAFWELVAAWLKGKTLAQQVMISFAVSMIFLTAGLLSAAGRGGYVFPEEWKDNALRAGPLPDPVSIEGILTSAGSFFGLTAGAAWIAARGGYQASGPAEKRALRYVIGLVGILILWYGLGQVFPRSESLIAYILRYVRYTLVGLWVVAGAPWLFFHFKLAQPPNG